MTRRFTSTRLLLAPRGTNNSPEGLDKGFTNCFFVTFKDKAGRKAYVPRPAHQEFVQLLGPSLDDVLVIDYWMHK